MTIKIAISRCLLGDNVRYDGTSKKCNEISQYINTIYEVIPYCPEVAIGLETPRLPMRLDFIDGDIRARQIRDPSEEYTELLKEYAFKFKHQHPDLRAVITKKGSPSCGHLSSKLFLKDDVINTEASGIFIAQLAKLMPDLMIIDELGFTNKWTRTEFLKLLK